MATQFGKQRLVGVHYGAFPLMDPGAEEQSIESSNAVADDGQGETAMADTDIRGRPSSEARERPLLMNEGEAARFLGFSERTLQTWRYRGGGPQFIRISPRCIRYLREDLLTWIEERKRKSTSDDGLEIGADDRSQEESGNRSASED